jgi:hypothetical protein
MWQSAMDGLMDGWMDGWMETGGGWCVGVNQVSWRA